MYVLSLDIYISPKIHYNLIKLLYKTFGLGRINDQNIMDMLTLITY